MLFQGIEVDQYQRNRGWRCGIQDKTVTMCEVLGFLLAACEIWIEILALVSNPSSPVLAIASIWEVNQQMGACLLAHSLTLSQMQ